MLDRNFVINMAYKDTDISDYILTLYNLVVQSNYKTIVELGMGESTFALIAAVNRTEGQLYSCDFDLETLNRFTQNGIDLIKDEKRFHFMQGNDLEVVKEWLVNKWSDPIDFLFIDTSHIYKQTKAELEVWPPFVKEGGQIALHDTAHESGEAVGTRIALNEFLEKEKGKYTVVHLLDPKVIGMSILVKI